MANKFEIHTTKPYLRHRIMATSENYAYGLGQHNKVTVYDKDYNDVTPSNAYIFPATRITEIFTTSVDGLIFVIYEGAAGYFSLYRSSTGGDGLIGSPAPGFVKVYDIGTNNSAQHKSAITTMQCGFCEATINGQRVLLLGEYNKVPVASRITGSSGNDQVSILASYDDGLTWSKLVTWDTVRSGYEYPNHQFDHIHAVRQNPYNGHIYICFGDSGANGPAVLAWNPACPMVEDNLDFDEIATRDGWFVGRGANQDQRWRYVDLLFTANYCHGITDAGQNSSSPLSYAVGIYRMPHDLSSLSLRKELYRPDVDINSVDTRFGWTGVVSPQGSIVFTEGMYAKSNLPVTGTSTSGIVRLTVANHGLLTGQEVKVRGVGGTTKANGFWTVTVIDANTIELNGCTDTNAWTSGGFVDRRIAECRVFCSSDEGGTYEMVGTYGQIVTPTSAIYPYTNIFGDAVLIGIGSVCGKNHYYDTATNRNGTAVLLDTGAEYNEEFPVIFSPVYFIDDAIGVDDTSLNSEYGYTPDKPWDKLEFAIRSGKVPYGSRIILAAGTHAMAADSVKTNQMVTDGQGTNRIALTVEGCGVDSTTLLGFNSGGAYSMLLNDHFDSNNASYIFKKMKLYGAVAANKPLFYVGNTPSIGTTLYLRDIKLGNESTASGRIIANFDKVDAKRVVFMQSPGIIHVVLERAVSSFYGSDVVFVGGSMQLYTSLTDVIFEIYNALFFGYTTSAIRFRSVNIVPKIKNAIFASAAGASYHIQNSSGTSVGTDDDINNNCFYGSGTNLAISNNGGTNRVAANPLFVDSAARNFALNGNSPCINAGAAITGRTVDIVGAPILGIPDIGPYENQGALNAYCGTWSPFDSTMPALSLASTAPGDLKQVQAWKKVATAKEIEKVK